MGLAVAEGLSFWDDYIFRDGITDKKIYSRGRSSHVIEKSHEPKIHVQLLVAVK